LTTKINGTRMPMQRMEIIYLCLVTIWNMTLSRRRKCSKD